MSCTIHITVSADLHTVPKDGEGRSVMVANHRNIRKSLCMKRAHCRLYNAIA